MNHMSVSIIKSAVRIVAGLVLIFTELGIANCYFFNHEVSGLFTFGVLFTVAELLGVLEEIVDKRKEK